LFSPSAESFVCFYDVEPKWLAKFLQEPVLGRGIASDHNTLIPIWDTLPRSGWALALAASLLLRPGVTQAG
jgi:hypothetical protein